MAYGVHRYKDPDWFDSQAAFRVRDHRSLGFLKTSGGYLGTDPADPSRALYNGFFFTLGE